MEQHDWEVRYQDRYLLTDSGTALVWPFLNVAKGDGPYELFLDTNALSKTQWVDQLPTEILRRVVVNPWPALMEQWLSNPEFRNDSTQRIKDMVAPLADRGVHFRPSYAREQTTLLSKNETLWRYQCSLLFPYIAIMRSLMREKVSPEEALARLDTFVHADVPRFAGSVMLMALAVLLKSKQSMKLPGASKPAYSYLDSFLAFQPAKKGEKDHINIPYLRNRSGDLSLWYAVPTLRQQGYDFIGEPVLVTADNVLHRVILRLIPPVLSETGMAGFYVASDELHRELQARILKAARDIQVRRSPGPEEIAPRLETQFRLAQEWCERPEEKKALEEAWLEWCKPGIGVKPILA
ncbi:hypothetical protein BZL41_26470 [Pseudomonas sp. PIC25]|uniref:hypothetical protein n=1 Tax=Pseudomonas sp. PIC25 TaxID=1958773 RepID=UPI000BD3C450|nr:hypothetical protein [Pseudomonas sp. PIC25]PAU51976.1 hypothetical protein BZL41_26470 [Pseudomonas sp. PIC25]